MCKFHQSNKSVNTKSATAKQIYRYDLTICNLLSNFMKLTVKWTVDNLLQLWVTKIQQTIDIDQITLQLIIHCLSRLL